MSFLDKLKFNAKKYSPEIFLGVSIVSGIGATAVACVATTKLSAIKEEYEEQVAEFEEAAEKGQVNGKEYTEEDAENDTKIVAAKRVVKTIAIYTPAVALTGLSIFAGVNSHNIMKKRNMALATAYTAVSTAFQTYANRVKAKFGEEAEREIRFGTETKTVQGTVTDKKGNVKTVETEEKVDQQNSVMPYTFKFDSTNPNYCKSRTLAISTLQGAQDWANNLMKARSPKYIFLNEVLEHIGMEPVSAGQIVGWTYNGRSHVNANGQPSDNVVDFGIFTEDYKPQLEAFRAGKIDEIYLTFNVDGPIYNLLKENK